MSLHYSLPFELVLWIVDFLQIDDEGFSKTQRRATGRSLALTCRALRNVGTALLWKEVKQCLGKEEDLLCHLIENDHVAQHVRYLQIETYRYLNTTGFERYRTLLNGCKRLERLELGGIDPSLFDAFLSTYEPPDTLRHLLVRSLGGWLDLGEPLSILLNRFRTLETLNVGLVGAATFELLQANRTIDGELASLAELEVRRLPLKELKLQIAGGNPQITSAILHLFTHKVVTPDLLTFLEVDLHVDLPEETWYRSFPNLSTLRLHLPYITFHNHLPLITASFPSLPLLEHLYLGISDHTPERSSNATAPARVLRHFLNTLPPLLKRTTLAITFPGGAQRDPLNSFLHDRRSMRLEEMIVAARFEEEEYRGLIWIKKRKEAKGDIRWAINVSSMPLLLSRASQGSDAFPSLQRAHSTEYVYV